MPALNMYKGRLKYMALSIARLIEVVTGAWGQTQLPGSLYVVWTEITPDLASLTTMKPHLNGKDKHMECMWKWESSEMI